MKFTKKDLFATILTGLITGLIVWRILLFLKYPSYNGISFVWLLVVVPIIWIVGVNFGYLLGRWIAFFNQFGRFAVIGFTNAAVDFGVLNLLIAWSGIAEGNWYSVFKAVSFLVAMIHSYMWNKYWAFNAAGTERVGGEFIKFVVVSVASLLVNVAVASMVVNSVHPLFGLDIKTWANVGAIFGSAAALIFNFAGLRLAVFRGTND